MSENSLHFNKIKASGKKERQVTEQMGYEFANRENLIYLGETSCYDSVNNCS